MTRNLKKLKDSSHRKETKEEKKKRLQHAKESREKCLKILPYVGGALLALMLLFAYCVHTLPLSAPKVKPQKLEVKSVPKKEEMIKPVEDDFPEQLLQDMKKDDDKGGGL